MEPAEPMEAAKAAGAHASPATSAVSSLGFSAKLWGGQSERLFHQLKTGNANPLGIYCWQVQAFIQGRSACS